VSTKPGEVQRVYKIIEKLLSFSRKYVPVRSYEDINNLVEQSLEVRIYRLNLENIKIIRELAPNLPKTMIDPNQIQQVFINILLNAEQAIIESHGHGIIEIKTRLKNDDIIEVSISDDGPGIPEEIRGKIFDPFFTTKEPGKGTGLGLSVSYGIIKEHGGDIDILNTEKNGTTFRIEIPVLDKIVSKGDYTYRINKEILNALKNKRVLIVEDEPMIVELLKSVLEEENILVDIASDGKEAIDRIDVNIYDLIICDIKMPVINGVTFYEVVQKTKPELTSKVIFITGDPSSETMDFLTRVGNPHIIKPFKIDKFKAQINKMLTTIH
jgi:CheY-like chemotaxis protein